MRRTAPAMGKAGSMPAGGMTVAVSRGRIESDKDEGIDHGEPLLLPP